jgi:hypothetical protein
MAERILDPVRGAEVARQLKVLGAKRVLVRAAELGYITELACAMQTCECPEELGGARYFVPGVTDWSPTNEHFPIPKREGGRETPDNSVLAHRLCNRIDYSREIGRSHERELARIEKARQVAISALATRAGSADTDGMPRSGSAIVRLDPSDPAFRRLVAETATIPGLYWFQQGDVVLKVGQSGKRAGRGSGIGNRLSHHVGVAFKDLPSHRRDFPAWHAFMRALINRTVTIRWLECSPEELDATERAAIRDAPGGVLWESLRGERLELKGHPERHAEFTRAVASRLR